jgi:hypothetical protein
MRRRGPAAGKPQPTYVGRPQQLCYQYTQTGPGGWKPQHTSVRCPQLSHQYAQTGPGGLGSPNITTKDALSSAINMRRWGPAAGKPQPTYVKSPQLCHQYAQMGPDGWKAPKDALSSAINMRKGWKAPTYYLRRMPLASSSPTVAEFTHCLGRCGVQTVKPIN